LPISAADEGKALLLPAGQPPHGLVRLKVSIPRRPHELIDRPRIAVHAGNVP
jgi:hypothetical protein